MAPLGMQMNDNTATIKFKYQDWEGNWHLLTAMRWAFDIRPDDWDDQVAAMYLGRHFSGNIHQAAADELADKPWLGNIASTPPGRVHAQRSGIPWVAKCGRSFAGSNAHGRFPLIVDMDVTCKSCLRSKENK